MNEFHNKERKKERKLLQYPKQNTKQLNNHQLKQQAAQNTGNTLEKALGETFSPLWQLELCFYSDSLLIGKQVQLEAINYLPGSWRRNHEKHRNTLKYKSMNTSSPDVKNLKVSLFYLYLYSIVFICAVAYIQNILNNMIIYFF